MKTWIFRKERKTEIVNVCFNLKRFYSSRCFKVYNTVFRYSDTVYNKWRCNTYNKCIINNRRVSGTLQLQILHKWYNNNYNNNKHTMKS